VYKSIKQSKVVTILLPAYNNPEYTRKTLKSIISQTYRPIELIFIDDNSPVSLKPLYDEFFSNNKDKTLIAKYYRNNTNFGPYFNLSLGMKKVTGKYLVIMQHDDWFVDKKFLDTSVSHMEKSLECSLVIYNSKIEGHDLTMFSHKFLNDPIELNGKKYLNKYLFKKIHPAYSGILMDYEQLRKLNYPNLFLSKKEAEELNIIPDESFLSLALLSEKGSVVISNKVVSVRGNPRNSYSKTAEWHSIWVLSVFFPFYKLLCYFIQKKSVKGSLGMFRAIIRLRRVTFSQIFQSVRNNGIHAYTFLFIINTFYSVIIDCIENPRRNISPLIPKRIKNSLRPKI
jgi:glycosyltransferase involved in cell wall biosynthesis